MLCCFHSLLYDIVKSVIIRIDHDFLGQKVHIGVLYAVNLTDRILDFCSAGNGICFLLFDVLQALFNDDPDMIIRKIVNHLFTIPAGGYQMRLFQNFQLMRYG